MNKTYKVVFAVSYNVDAEDDTDAVDIATELFKDDLGSESEIQLGLFGCSAEEE